MNYIEINNGYRFEIKGKKYIAMNVDVSDFSNSVAVGYVGFVKPTSAGVELGAIPNADSQVIELAVYTGFKGSNFDPRNPEGVSGNAATSDDVYIFCVEGECKALVDGTADIAADDPLEILKNTSNFVLNGSTGTPVWDVKTHAIAGEAVTADEATLAKVVLVGGKNTPSAS